MNAKTVLLALTLVLALVISTSEARNYYVAPGGNRQPSRQKSKSKHFKNPFLKRFMESYYGSREPYMNPEDIDAMYRNNDLEVE